jgi:GTP pyrophosphokinase
MPKAVQEAFAFADKKHEGQVRLYSHEQYINHPLRVAQQLIDWQYTNPVTLQVALLHDVLEDTPCTISEIVRNFGHEVAAKVRLLTESPDPLLKREDRKLLHNHILRSADDDVQLVKVADISDNLLDFSVLHEADRKFAKMYLEEKKVTLLSLNGRYGFSERHELLKTIQTLTEEFNLR